MFFTQMILTNYDDICCHAKGRKIKKTLRQNTASDIAIGEEPRHKPTPPLEINPVLAYNLGMRKETGQFCPARLGAAIT